MLLLRLPHISNYQSTSSAFNIGNYTISLASLQAQLQIILETNVCTAYKLSRETKVEVSDHNAPCQVCVGTPQSDCEVQW